ncbi:glycosyl transferase [Mannheimia granulomatis]|uniref:glycosyltransferase family 2 protein n=1 Tax=Mannheimia granulomatis TaxID=85402 RepID=UPI00159D2A30|nr:glycosyltransferase family 2 protein [Mannheimia granulomatis]QLB15462.1 glycosyl transferase [Mannheimia granulomatis]
MNKSICAIVVTYNRKSLLLKCLSALKDQTIRLDHIVVIDNASIDGTVEFLAQNGWLNSEKFTLLTLSSNQGGAGGFYEGIKYAYEHYFDYIWLMDDDGVPDIFCLEKLLPYASENNYIGPLVLNIDNKDELTFPLRLPKSKTVLSTIQDIKSGRFNQIIPDIVMPFNGILFSRKLVERIGFPHKEFFIWGDDMEYTWRARKAGYEITTIIDAKFYHPKELTLGTPMFFNLLKFNDTESKLKLYCMCRNNIRNLLDYKGLSISLLFCTKVIWFYLFTKPNLSKLKLGLVGIWHGLKKNFTQHRKFLK